jgi:hypothetical protein
VHRSRVLWKPQHRETCREEVRNGEACIVAGVFKASKPEPQEWPLLPTMTFLASLWTKLNIFKGPKSTFKEWFKKHEFRCESVNL